MKEDHVASAMAAEEQAGGQGKWVGGVLPKIFEEVVPWQEVWEELE